MQDSFQLARDVHAFFKTFGIDLSPAVAGFIGALISLRFLATMTPVQVWITLATGFATSGYLTPVVQAYFTTLPPGGIGFAVGFLSMGLLGGSMELLNDWKKAPGDFIKKFFNRGNGQ